MGRSNRIKPKRLGEKLRLIRESLSLTQEQIIERLDYKSSKLYPQNISGFEKSEREPNLDKFLPDWKKLKTELNKLPVSHSVWTY